MNKYFIIILYVVEGSEKLFTFCMVSIFRKMFRTEWFRKFVFNFNLTGVKYLIFIISEENNNSWVLVWQFSMD